MSTYAGNKTIAERSEVQAQLVREAGWIQPETRVPVGTALLPEGVQALRQLQTEINALPDASTLLPRFLAAEEARKPVDVTAPIGKIRMNSTGHLQRVLPSGSLGPAIGYTHTGLGQLVQFYGEALGVPRNWVNGLEFLTPSARAVAFNDMATRAEVAESFDADPRVVRTILNGNGDRVLRAVTSTKHVLDRGDARAVAKLLGTVLPKGAKLRIHRAWDRVDFEVFYPMMNREILVGDIVLGRTSVSISETKDISGSALAGLLRCLCYNFTTAWFGGESIFHAKHIGADFIARLSKAFADATTKIQPFVQAFGDAYKVALPSGQTRASVLHKAERRFELEADVIKNAIASWDADGVKSAGNTLAGAVNALTRASQLQTFADAEVTEAAAGELAARGWAALDGPAPELN